MRARRGARAGVLRAVPGANAGTRASGRAASKPGAPCLRPRPSGRASASVITDPLDRDHASSESARLTVIVLR